MNQPNTVAEHPGTPGSNAATAQYLVFRVSDLDVAVALASVSEILEHGAVAVAPGAPRYVRGVIQVRGRLLPVIDMAIKLGREPQPPTKRACIVVLEVALEGMVVPVGLVADSVDTLVDVPRQQVEAPPLFGAGIDIAFLEGFFRYKEAMLPLIDVHKVFSNEELLRATLEEQRARAQLAEKSAATAQVTRAETPAASPGKPPKVEMEIWDD